MLSKNHLLILLLLLLFSASSISQTTSKTENTIYIVDSIAIENKKAETHMFQNELKIENEDIYSMDALFDKTKLIKLGYYDVDTAIFITTRAYHNRPEKLKKIPATANMIMDKQGRLYLKNKTTPYTGPFRDYYISGSLSATGKIKDGYYTDTLKHYYEDGITLKSWEFERQSIPEYPTALYHRNGKIFCSGKMAKEGAGAVRTGTWQQWYSTGMYKTTEIYTAGKVDHLPEEMPYWNEFVKGKDARENKEYQKAINYLTNAIKAKNTIDNAWLEKGKAESALNLYDSAISDFNQALQLEPLLTEALCERVLARIKKNIPAGKTEAEANISDMPKTEKAKICLDFNLIYQQMQDGAKLPFSFLIQGITEKTIMGEIKKYCH